MTIAASKEEIREWFIEGVNGKHKYMVVVYDLMEFPDNSDTAYYADSTEKVLDMVARFRKDELSEVMEVYDLMADMDAQLAEKRAWHLPLS